MDRSFKIGVCKYLTESTMAVDSDYHDAPRAPIGWAQHVQRGCAPTMAQCGSGSPWERVDVSGALHGGIPSEVRTEPRDQEGLLYWCCCRREPNPSMHPQCLSKMTPIGYYSGGRVKMEGLDVQPGGTWDFIITANRSSHSSGSNFHKGSVYLDRDGFSGCGQCSGINARLPLSGDERRLGAAVPPFAAGHSVQWTIALPRVLNEPHQWPGLHQIWVFRCAGCRVVCHWKKGYYGKYILEAMLNRVFG